MNLYQTIGLLCLALLPVLVFAQDEAEAPPGYEDAPVADEPTPVPEAEAADAEQPQDNFEAPPGYEDAPVADEPLPQAEGAEAEVRAAPMDVILDPNIANLEKQFLPQFQPLWKAEVAFVQRVCQLDRAQRVQIQQVKDDATAAAARTYAIRHGNGVRRVDPMGGVREIGIISPRKLIQKQMEQLASEELRPEQATQYQDECVKRDAHRRRVTVLNLVARLDEELVLTAEQRDKLVESLDSNYQDTWHQSLEMLQHNRQYLPNIPDQHVTSILNATQQSVWRGVQKLNFSGGGGFGQAIVVVEDEVMVDDAGVTQEVVDDGAEVDATAAEQGVAETDGD